MARYRCQKCRSLLVGPEGKHGDRCPMCESGNLEVVARVTKRMIEQAERA